MLLMLLQPLPAPPLPPLPSQSQLLITTPLPSEAGQVPTELGQLLLTVTFDLRATPS